MYKELWNVIANDLEKLARDIRILGDDDLDMNDDTTIDEAGDSKDITKEEKAALEKKRAEDGLAAIIESNSIPEVSIDEVREKLVALSHKGKKDFVKALLSRYGADKLSSVKTEDYASLLYDASKECD